MCRAVPERAALLALAVVLDGVDDAFHVQALAHSLASVGLTSNDAVISPHSMASLSHYADGSIDMEHHQLKGGRRVWVCWGVHEELQKRGYISLEGH